MNLPVSRKRSRSSSKLSRRRPVAKTAEKKESQAQSAATISNSRAGSLRGGGRGQVSKPMSASPPTAESRASVAGRRCPLCRKGQIILGQRGWGCGRWREGCTLVLWFELDGVVIPVDEATRLFERKQSRLFHEREGRRWRLVFDEGGPPWFRWEAGKRRSGGAGGRSQAGKKTGARRRRSSAQGGQSSSAGGWRQFQKK